MKPHLTVIFIGMLLSSTFAFGEDPYHYLYIEGENIHPDYIFPGVNFAAGLGNDSYRSKEHEPGGHGSSRTEVGMQHYKDWLKSLGANKSRTFSVMLFCRELSKEETYQIPRLYSAFQSFSHYIGETNTAVWIGRERPPSFDLNIGKDLCDRYNLDYNGGPYIVYYRIKSASLSSSSIPSWQFPGMNVETESVTINLHRIATERIPNVLNLLEMYIRKGLETNDIRGPLAFALATQWLFSFGEKYLDATKIPETLFKGSAHFSLKWGTKS
ncbi:MAG: hypothetical protein NW701_02975 [Nitrospira sp.]